MMFHNRNRNRHALNLNNQNNQQNRHFNPNRNGQNLNHIIFTTSNNTIQTPTTTSSDYLKKSITLFDNLNNIKFLKIIPKNFIITTNSGSCNFNTEVLKNTSSVISNFILKNPDSLQYHLDITDEENVLKKFEMLYQGITVFFQENDIPVYQEIKKLLKIFGLPNYVTQQPNPNQHSFTFEMKCDIKDGLKIEEISFNKFLKENGLKIFTISTQKKEYKCNIFGVLSSKVISDFLAKEPKSNHYFFDITDESDNFQIFCDLFNFYTLSITQDNVFYLKEVAESLQINYILDDINRYSTEIEKSLNKIDDILTDTMENIEELFDCLYNIKTITVPIVKKSILNSNWIKSEEKIQEFAASILQVIKTDIQLHKYLLDLLEELDKEAIEHDFLKILIPFIIKQLLLNFAENNANCSFIYNLYKRKFISDNDIIEKLKQKSKNDYIRSWFLPELIENDIFEENSENEFNHDPFNQINFYRNRNRNYHRNIQKELDSDVAKLINTYYPDNIDFYRKMRDSGEPDNILTKAIRNDDIDTVQSIISQNINKTADLTIPYNIFENFVPNGKTNYIDYSAAYGSIKCFKYFLLNHHDITDETFRLAVFGGNTEIIKIIDQNLDEKNNYSDTNLGRNMGANRFNAGPPNLGRNMGVNRFNAIPPNLGRNMGVNRFNAGPPNFGRIMGANRFVPKQNSAKILDFYTKTAPSIIKHRNDIFDWIIENKFNNVSDKTETLCNLLELSAKNGNIHSIIGIIDKGFDPIDNLTFFKILLKYAAKYGFYELTKFLLEVSSQKFKGIRDYSRKKNSFKYIATNNDTNLTFDSFVLFGNLNIFKIGLETKPTSNILEKAFVVACEMNNTKIIDYFFNELFDKKFKISNQGISEALSSSIKIKRTDLFDYLLKQYEQFDKLADNPCILYRLLDVACKEGNLEVTKKIITLLLNLKSNSEIDATSYFITAASTNFDICNYFFNQKLNLNCKIILLNDEKLGAISKEIFCSMIKELDQTQKYEFSNYFLISGVKKQNIELVDYLLSEGITYDDILIDAVRTHNLELVNTVLKYNSKPSFVNTKRSNGTALFWAVSNNDCSIIQRLISISGIDANIPDERGVYPLLHACLNNRIKAIELLLKSGKVNPNLSSSYDDGNSILMSTLANKNEKAAKILIEYPETDINARNYNDFSALIIAVTLQQISIINLLLTNERFDPDESRLNYAFYLSQGEASNYLILSESLDVNYLYSKKLHKYSTSRNLHNYTFYNNNIGVNSDEVSYESTLINAVKMCDFAKVCLILQHPKFDNNRSKINEAIRISSSSNTEKGNKICNKLLDYSDIKFGFNTVLNQKNIEMITKILNDPKFEFNYEVFDMTINQLSYFPADQITQLFILLCIYAKERIDSFDANRLLSNGKTIFTFIMTIYYIDFNEIADVLLDCGANPNIPDKFGNYPLELAMKSKNMNLITDLILSDKFQIDYSKKIKKIKKNEDGFYSYLHLAIELNNSTIVSRLLDQKLIDINVTDDMGDTPLILAVKLKNNYIINELFKHNELDYLHRDNDGHDALSFTKYKQDQQVEDKDEYLRLIIQNI